mgnify:FL=1
MTERDRFIQDNLKLVHSCCLRFKNKGIEYDDLFSSGCLGLVKAYDRFDKSLGFAFSTYAVPVILGEIKRLFREDGAVKVGRRLKDTARAVMNEREKMSRELSREPTVSELAAALGLTAEQVTEAVCASKPVLSLDYTDDDFDEPMQLLSSDESEKVIGSIALSQSLEKLTEKDKALINLRYFQNSTQSVTASKLGMTQVQVSRREKVILQKLREQMTG